MSREPSTPVPAPGAGMPTLTDGIVTLRAHRFEDVPAVVRQCQDPQMVRWTQVPVPFEAADAEDFVATSLANWHTGTEYTFAIEVSGRYAGSLDLRPRPAGGGEVGFGLGPWARHRGTMSRAMRLCLRWGFEHVGLDVVHWQAHVGNWESRRVAWATGFRVEGTVRGLLPHRGERVDGWIGSVRRGDSLSPAHAWLDPPRLDARNVVLREHVDGDLFRIAEACRDPQTRFWLAGLPSPYTERDAAEHVESIRAEQASGRGMYWAVTGADGDKLLGEIGLFVRDDGGRQGEIGYWAHPDARGRGLTTEATRLVVRHALLPVEVGGLGMHRVLLRAATGNLASLRVAEKAGFRRIGIERRADPLRDGTLADDVRFDLIADELPPVGDRSRGP